MRTVLLGMALAAHPYADPFWARELTPLVERLAEAPLDPADAEQQRLFGDVVRFINCEPLAPLAPLKPEEAPPVPRTLLRLEAARRARLGATAATSATLWRDVLTPGFFRRAPVLSRDEGLRWPLEPEQWSGEKLELKLRASSCAQPGPTEGDELPLLTDELEQDARKALGPEVAHRLLYHRASRLLMLGRDEDARKLALGLEPSALDEALRPLGQLLRLGLGIDPPEGYLALVNEPRLAPLRLSVTAQATAYLSAQGRWREVLELTAPLASTSSRVPSLDEPVLWDVFYRRALALQALGERNALARLWPAVFPALARSQEARVEALRGIALADLARGTLDTPAQTLLRDLGSAAGLTGRLSTLGGLALDRGNTRLALEVAEQLAREKAAPARARGHTLRAEVALAQGDAEGLTRAMDRLNVLRRQEVIPSRELPEVDRVVMALAQALVTASADLTEARWRPLLVRGLDGMRQGVHARHEKTFAVLLAALEDRGPQQAAKGKRLESFVAVGQVAVGAPPGLLPPPAFTVSWPEPFSLLSLPVDGNTWRDWFPREALPPPSPVSAPAKTEVSHAP